MHGINEPDATPPRSSFSLEKLFKINLLRNK